MPASFREVRPYSGVDETAKGGPAMIVPLGGTNLIRLVNGQNFNVPPVRGLQVDAIPNAELMTELMMIAALTLTANDYAAQARWSILAQLRSGDQRFFKIKADHKLGKNGVTLTATSGAQNANIKIVPLDKRTVTLAIRPVQYKDTNGNLVNHSQVPFDAQDMCNKMNSIWTPQANVEFKLISTKPALVDDKIKAQIAQILGTSIFPNFFDIDAMIDVLKSWASEGPKAELTMFLVQRAKWDGDFPYGITRASAGISLIPDIRHDDTMAHEAGHFLGVDDLDPKHFPEPCLMCNVRSLKIPFDQTIKTFNTNY